jgi:3D (Asp-Asp-Asp) domain-containing protein
MLRIVKMISLSFLAATLCEQTSLSLPSYLLQANSPMHHVMVSAYTNHPKCTGSTRGVTASSLRLSEEDNGKIIALSPDLARRYNYGDHFKLWVRGKAHEVSFQDRMSNGQKMKVDLLLPSIRSCIQFGRNPGILIPLGNT